MISMNPIGTVKTAAVKHAGEWGEVVSEIILDETLTDGLKGLTDFSHLVIIYYMHQTAFNPQTDLIKRPRGRQDMPLVGVFALRSPYRPNPIGITNVRLLQVKGNTLIVQGLDALDGTPVLDIKPYTPGFDQIEKPTFPDWTVRLI